MQSPALVGPERPETVSGETIAALATPPGRGAIAVVRVSGPHVQAIAERLLRPPARLRPGRAHLAAIVDRNEETIDRGIVLFWRAPKSYTGEDVLELHVHGAPVVVRQVLESTFAAGARLAQPGEFTRRAFLNGKMELSTAQAVADVIAAESRAAARAALANLGGALANAVRIHRATLRGLLEELAGAIDFPDEVPDPDPQRLDRALAEIEAQLAALRATGELGRMIREGVSVAIVGPPNAGKSSLLNALLGEERALVSEIAGTTRDTIEESVEIDGVAVRLTDTAGVRAHADRLEAAGIARTLRVLDEARIALVVLDGSRRLDEAARRLLEQTADRERVLFCNKADLGDAGAREIAEHAPIVGSAFEHETLVAIREAIARVGWNGESLDLSRPHLATSAEIAAVEEALASLAIARATLLGGEPVDLCAGELQQAIAALGHVSGEQVAEEIIDGIFARFCIGK